MTIGEAIKILQAFEREHGPDLAFITLTEVDGRFCMDWDRKIDIIEVPTCEEDHGECFEHMERVCAFLDIEEPVPPHLRVVQ